MTSIDIIIKIFTVGFLVYVGYKTIQNYNRIYNLQMIPHGMVDVLERSMYLCAFLVFVNLALLLSAISGNIEYTQHMNTINHVSFLVGAFLFYEANKNRLEANKKVVDKETKIRKITKKMITEFGADRVAVIEYHDNMRYASLRYCEALLPEYDVSKHWQNMPIGTIKAFADACKNRGVFKAPNTAEYPDKDVAQVMQGYKHKSLYMQGIQIDGVDVGYVALMYVEDTNELDNYSLTVLAERCEQIEQIIRDNT